MTTPEFHATRGVTDAEIEGLPAFTSMGGDWSNISEEVVQLAQDRIVMNLGPVHPSTHGVLRLVCELDGEYVRQVEAQTGFLHTGIEKSMEYRTWTQGVAYATRMDYVASIFQEVGYCLAVEKLLGIEDRIPKRANVIRVMLMELQRLASHYIAIGSSFNELGATTMMTLALRGREDVFRILERITGQRMNNSFMRPGGVLEDVDPGCTDYIRELLPKIRLACDEMFGIVGANPIVVSRCKDVAVLSLPALVALGQTGPGIRAAGVPLDLRKTMPYCDYETYEFDVPVYDKSDALNRTYVRFDEMFQSIRIIYQCVERLEKTVGDPVMIDDKKIAWPAKLALGEDGQGTDPEHVKRIMGTNMEELIHHFKMATEGFRVPAGQGFAMIEHAKGIWGCHAVSDGGNRPYRIHVDDPSYRNLQGMSMMAEGGLIADAIVALAVIDPVMGGVDR
ncbi:MAG: NADH-quinone oxidoreductase subunit D [Actinomycetaceae bacterium]|nr:NADH-quinone oxidoreductase subunit D [Actinomycetaceae bacterium]